MDRRTALTTIFMPIASNILKNPSEVKFRTLREGNGMIMKGFAALSDTSGGVEEYEGDDLERKRAAIKHAGGDDNDGTDTTNCDDDDGAALSLSSSLRLVASIDLATCTAPVLLSTVGFQRVMRPIANNNTTSGSGQEAVWTLRYAGEKEDEGATTTRSAHGRLFLLDAETVKRTLEQLLEKITAFCQSSSSHVFGATSSINHGRGGGLASIASNSSLFPHSSSLNANSYGGGAAGVGVASASQHSPLPSSSFVGAGDGEEIDLDQIKRLKELKAAAKLQQKHQISSASAAAASADAASTAAADAAAAAAADEASDFAAVAHLVDKVKLTIHRTGRLRNYSFEARDFTLRRMTKGRMAHLCAHDRCLQRGEWAVPSPTPPTATSINATETCGSSSAAAASAANPSSELSSASASAATDVVAPVGDERGDCLEAHWHVRNANMIYSYVAHLSPNGDKVLHMGEEFGYQYNSLPGTPHFGKTILLSIKKVNMDTNMLESMKHPNKPSEKCIVCGVPFPKLWL